MMVGMKICSSRDRRQWAYALLGRANRSWCAVRFMGRSKPTVAVVVAGWTPHDTDAACGLIEDWIRSQQILVSVRILATSVPTLVAPSGYTIVRADNSGLDLGAMAEGLRVASLANSPKPDYYLVGNDRISHYEIDSPILRHFTAGSLSRRRKIPAIVGKLHQSRREFTIGGLPTSCWIQTHLMLIQSELAERVDVAETLERTKDLNLHFTPTGGLVSDSVVADRQFCDFLERALIAGRSFERSEWLWYKAKPIGETDLSYISAKARAITVERYLAASVLSSGGVLVDAASFDAFDFMTERLSVLCGQVWRRQGIMKLHRFLGHGVMADSAVRGRVATCQHIRMGSGD